MMEVLIACTLCTLAHVPSLILRYLPFSRGVEKQKRRLLFCLYGIALILNWILCAELVKKGLLTIPFFKMNLLLFCVLLAGVNILLIPGYLQEHLFTFGLVAILVLIMTASSAFFTDLIGYHDVTQGLIYANLFFMGMFLLFYIPLSRLMIKTVMPFLNLESKEYWHTVWFIPIAMFFASLLSISVNAYTENLQQLISKLLVCIATIFICQTMARDFEQMAENQYLNLQMEEQRQYYSALSDRMKAEQEARHNYKHHVVVMKSFLEHEDTDKLNDYVRQFVSEQPGDMPLPHSGNSAVDGILMHYMQRTAAEGIAFEISCAINGKGYSDMDLCNLLGNALENALTAARAAEKNPWIRVMAETKNNMLLITVTNSFDGLIQTKNSHILSRKRVMEEGIGIYTMKTICKKYSGVSDFTWKGKEFHASFMLVGQA